MLFCVLSFLGRSFSVIYRHPPFGLLARMVVTYLASPVSDVRRRFAPHCPPGVVRSPASSRNERKREWGTRKLTGGMQKVYNSQKNDGGSAPTGGMPTAQKGWIGISWQRHYPLLVKDVKGRWKRGSSRRVNRGGDATLSTGPTVGGIHSCCCGDPSGVIGLLYSPVKPPYRGGEGWVAVRHHK